MASAPSLRVGAMALGPIKAKLGITNFRQGQLECISALALRGRDAWVGFACGGGKSLVFAAAMLLLSGVGILIEPLDAISTAMSTYLLARAIKTILLDGTEAARALAIHALHGDPDQDPVVIIGSPKRVLHEDILKAMQSPLPRGDQRRILAALGNEMLKKSMTSRVSLIGIDEVHIIAQWSEEFRVDYARLGKLRAAVHTWDFHSAPICAMTATATPAVRSAVKKSIGFSDVGATEQIHSLCRPNVRIHVHAPGNVSGAATKIAVKAKCVVHALHSSGVVLVFVGTHRATSTVAKAIRGAILTETSLGAIEVAEYHGQHNRPLLALRRAQFEAAASDAVDAVAAGTQSASVPSATAALRPARVLVSTIAFGMGVDIPGGVNTVVLWDAPGSPSDMYQMAQRGGRDGKTPCTVHIYVSYAERQIWKRRGIDLLAKADGPSTAARQAKADAGIKVIAAADAVYAFAMDVSRCRHFTIDAMFGVPESMRGGDCEDRCDVCCKAANLLTPPTVEEAKKIDAALRPLVVRCREFGEPLQNLCAGVKRGSGVVLKKVAFRVRQLISEKKLEDRPAAAVGDGWTIRHGESYGSFRAHTSSVPRARDCAPPLPVRRPAKKARKAGKAKKRGGRT